MKVQNEMSTRISVNAVSAIGSMSAFRNAIRGASDAWRAQEVALKNSGNYTEAVKTRLSGLNQVIDLQKAKISELRSRQEGLNTANQKQAAQFLKLEKQIQQANKQLASYEGQATRAKESATYYASGLASLQHQMKLGTAVSQSYVAALRANGKAAKADQAEFNSLRSHLSDLKSQYSKQAFLLKQVANQSGKTSDAYKKQQVELNRTSEAIGKTKTRLRELDKALNPPRVSAWHVVREDILQVSKAEEKAKQGAVNFGGALKASIMGGWIQQGFSTITGQMKSIVTNGMAAAKAGAAMEARWKNIGVNANGIKQLTAQVGNLKTNTYLSAQAVNSLQTRFYGMTHSVRQTKLLTQSVGSLTDKLKLSEQQSNAFASGLARIESSGKVSSRTLGRLEKQAPGLTAALQKASGMSKQAFNTLLSSGKMTSDQFNQLMVKASGDYKKNSKAFDQTSGGAMHKLRQEWATTQAKLAKPLLKVSSTGLNELSKALNNKDTQRGLQFMAKGLATAAVNAAKFIGFIAKHQTTVKVFGGSVLALAGAFKAMQSAVVVADVIKKFGKLKGTVTVVSGLTKGVKGLGAAFKIGISGLNPWIVGIGLVVAGFTALYKHNKKFRKFINGLVNSAKSGMKKVGKWFSTTFKNIGKEHAKAAKQQQKQNRQSQRDWDKHMKSLKKGWNNFWKDYNKTQSRNIKNSAKAWNQLRQKTSKTNSRLWKSVRKSAANGWKNFETSVQRGTRNVSKYYQQMQRATGRLLENMRKHHPRTFNLMYKIIEDRSRIWHDVATGHWNRLGSDTANLAKDMNRTSRSIFGDMYDKLNDLTGGRLNDIRNTWNKVLNQIHDAIVNIGGTIHKAWDSLMNGIIDVFGGLINNIIKGINWVVDKVGGEGHIAEIKLAHFAQGSNGPIAKHQLAVLNDAPGDQYREMVHKHGTGKTFMLPAKRNIVMPLEPGDEVLDGKRSAEMMQAMGLPRYAGGAIGNFFSGVFDKVGDAIDDATDWVEKALKNIVEFGKELFSHFISPIKPKANDVLGNGMKTGFPGYFAKALQKWMKKQLDQLSTANPPGTGVERWRPVIIRAFNALHVAPAEWKVNKLLRQIQTESNGDPNAFQHGYHDANSGGNEARGLLQFALSTWRADALPGHTDWHSGYNEILAAINVLEHGGEGGWGNVGNGHGWANGGLVTQHGIYEVAEGNNPEMIIPLDPNKRGRAYSLLSQVISQFKHEDSSDNATSANGANALGKKLDALVAQNQQLLGLIDKLIGVTDSVNNPTRRYRRTQHDINMAQFQSLT